MKRLCDVSKEGPYDGVNLERKPALSEVEWAERLCASDSFAVRDGDEA